MKTPEIGGTPEQQEKNLLVLKNFQISFSLIKEEYKVFSPLRYENDLFIMGKTNTIKLK